MPIIPSKGNENYFQPSFKGKIYSLFLAFTMELEEFKRIKEMLNYIKLLTISVGLSSLYTTAFIL